MTHRKTARTMRNLIEHLSTTPMDGAMAQKLIERAVASVYVATRGADAKCVVGAFKTHLRAFPNPAHELPLFYGD